jgi:hypothetical protein
MTFCTARSGPRGPRKKRLLGRWGCLSERCSGTFQRFNREVIFASSGEDQTNRVSTSPSSLIRQNLHDDPPNRASKTRHGWRTTLLNDPVDDHRRARSAPADGDHRDHIGDARLQGASPVKFKIGQHIDIDGLSDCVIGNAGRGAQRGWLYLHVTPPDCWDYGTIVPIDPDGGFRPDLAWAKASEPSKERDIEWEVVDE